VSRDACTRTTGRSASIVCCTAQKRGAQSCTGMQPWQCPWAGSARWRHKSILTREDSHASCYPGMRTRQFPARRAVQTITSQRVTTNSVLHVWQAIDTVCSLQGNICRSGASFTPFFCRVVPSLPALRFCGVRSTYRKRIEEQNTAGERETRLPYRRAEPTRVRQTWRVSTGSPC
jgi:hypothetical protein